MDVRLATALQVLHVLRKGAGNSSCAIKTPSSRPGTSTLLPTVRGARGGRRLASERQRPLRPRLRLGLRRKRPCRHVLAELAHGRRAGANHVGGGRRLEQRRGEGVLVAQLVGGQHRPSVEQQVEQPLAAGEGERAPLELREAEQQPQRRDAQLLSRQRDQRGEGVAGCGARRGRDGGDERTQSGLHACHLAVRRESSARAAELRGGRKGAHLCPRVARAQQLRQRVRRAAARRLPQHENAAAPRARRAAHRRQCRVARATSGRLELPPERAEQSAGGERLVGGGVASRFE
mmetsp:Transcript_25263/g.84069  ORF Transcript_25263/g.84069 Transcript_25263/m.84069 type:complete len:291 (+) Transcript_25263:49-921(+)